MLRTLAPYLVYSIVSLIGWTSRIKRVGRENVTALQKAGQPFIYAFWHNRQVFFTYTHRNAGFSVLVSRSRDGEVIAKTMELSGIDAIRGSSSRGAAAAARELLERLEAGRSVGITPDGPKGPAREVKTGVIFLAQKSGAPIIPITNAVSRKIVFRRSWDKFQVPLPFSKACVIEGAAFYVRPEDDPDAKALELKKAMDQYADEADRFVGDVV